VAAASRMVYFRLTLLRGKRERERVWMIQREREREMGVQGREREHEKKLLSSILRRGTVLSVPLDFKVRMNG